VIYSSGKIISIYQLRKGMYERWGKEPDIEKWDSRLLVRARGGGKGLAHNKGDLLASISAGLEEGVV
jgi:hypothetical protein